MPLGKLQFPPAGGASPPFALARKSGLAFAGSGSQFSPLDDLPSVWLKDLATTSGGKITSWLDKSGNGEHFPQGLVANQPIPSTLNGRFAVSWDGVNDYLNNSTLSLMPPFTIFFVVRQDSDQGNAVSRFYSTGGPPFGVFYYDGRTGAQLPREYVTGTDSGSITHNETPPDLSLVYYTVEFNGASSALYRNNTLLASGSFGFPGTITDWFLGSSSTPANFMHMTAGEFLAYPQIFSAGRKIDYDNYMNATWGI